MLAVTRPVVGARVKICGLRKPQEVQIAAEAGAAYIGFVFFPKSPRAVGIDQARDLAQVVPPGLAKVGLVVNMENAELDAVLAQVPLDMLQLHGAETPERVAEIRKRTGLPVMKAIGLRNAEDLDNIASYVDVADQLLIDAKPPKGAVLPGGNGVGFDHALIAGRQWNIPWMLAGGLSPDNVGEAIRLTGARQVDVSSGVETAPGVKDLLKIADFCAAAGA